MNKVVVKEIRTPFSNYPKYKHWQLRATYKEVKGEIIADVYSSERDAKLIAGWIDKFVKSGGLELDV
jgi:hypothetical protein